MVLGSTGGCQQDREAGLGPGELPCLGPAQKGLESVLQVRGRCLEQSTSPLPQPRASHFLEERSKAQRGPCDHPTFPAFAFAHRCSSGMCFLTTFQMSLQGSFLQEAHLACPCPSCCAAKAHLLTDLHGCSYGNGPGLPELDWRTREQDGHPCAVLGDCCPGAAALESELVQDTRPQSPAGPPLEDQALATLCVCLQHRLSISLQNNSHQR
ncbi:hypothetical protein CapIbe_012439 [Capra ibex]